MYPLQSHFIAIRATYPILEIARDYLDRGNNLNILLFKEALMFKKHRPSPDCVLKASKELQVFRLQFNGFTRHLVPLISN